jgi:hypothetical protein
MQLIRNDREGSKAVSILLVAIGLVAMAVSMFMNARFGWGLSEDFADRTAMAILHILVDPAAAALVVAGALMLRWGWKAEGRGFLFIAVILISWSMLSVYGFMSSRIAMVVSHDKIVEFDKSRLSWTQGSSINTDVARGDRRLLRAESKELAQKIRTQLSFIPDSQAASIASALGVQVEKVQRFLVMVSSGIAQTIKFVCLLAGGMIWPRLKVSRDLSHREGSDGGGEGKDRQESRKEPEKPKGNVERFPGKDQPKPAAAVKVSTPLPMLPRPRNENSRQPLDEYLQELLARGRKLESQTQIARGSGWSEPKVSKLLAKWEKAGKIKRDRSGNRKSVRIRMGDGGGRQALAVG